MAKARSAGRPVLVDFTADWCLTCQVNKKTSIEIASVRAKLKDINAVALLGDYTRFSRQHHDGTEPFQSRRSAFGAGLSPGFRRRAHRPA